ncbi:Basic domain-containing protein [Cladophialophora immunda]|nr:Basic domain-containing protein [Cladophialophora immunda]
MSGYRGRTGPNFSEYLNNLNTLASPYDQEQFPTEELDISQDLAMFTNTDFTHFDIPPLPEDGSFNFDLGDSKTNPNNVKYEELLSGSSPTHNYQPSNIDTSAGDSSHYYGTYNTPIQPAPIPGFNNLDSHTSPGTSTATGPQAARRKGDAVDANILNPEEKSRLAAEEDKRRRNTAASARFRVKKKQREQALERTVKEVQEKNAKLEAKVNQLEMENKWLKDLITEKNGMSSKEEMAAAYQQYRKESEERELKLHEHTTGVGTD